MMAQLIRCVQLLVLLQALDGPNVLFLTSVKLCPIVAAAAAADTGWALCVICYVSEA
jgi:hypothetical protein